MATIIGVITVISPDEKEIPIAKPSKKLWIKDDSMFRYPAIPFPFKLPKQPLSCSGASILFSDRRDCS